FPGLALRRGYEARCVKPSGGDGVMACVSGAGLIGTVIAGCVLLKIHAGLVVAVVYENWKSGEDPLDPVRSPAAQHAVEPAVPAAAESLDLAERQGIRNASGQLL